MHFVYPVCVLCMHAERGGGVKLIGVADVNPVTTHLDRGALMKYFDRGVTKFLLAQRIVRHFPH